MNTLKRSFAIILCLLLALTCLAGCHEKGEIAVTIGDVNFTSGYYACALVYADTEARSLVEEQLSAQGSLPQEIKYWDYKVEETDYVTWVENTAIKNLKKIAATKTLCAQAGVTTDASDESMAKTNVDYLWDNGYSELMQENGVSKETFIQYMTDGFLADKYFDSLYGEKGTKAISDEELNKRLSENYVLVNIIEADFSSFSEENITETTAQFTKYKAMLEAGTKTFEQIDLEYNKISEEDHKHEEPADGELAPKDAHATILGNDTTDYYSDNFGEAKNMAVGDIRVLTYAEKKGIALVVKQDIMADPYYIDYLDLNLRREIVGDTFENDVMAFADSLALDINTSSTKQFKVKKLHYPEMVGY